MPQPRIALVGPGAIGSTIAAAVHEAGHPVLLCGRTARETVEVRPDDDEDGDGDGGGGGDPIIVGGPVHTDPAGLTDTADVVLLAVKDTQNAQAAAWLSRLCGDETVVCALQNGVEQIERVGRYCPGAIVVPSVVWFSAETQPAGWVRLRTPVRLILPDDEPARRTAEIFRGSRARVDLESDFVTATWNKLLRNAVAGLMVLTGRRSGMFRRDDVIALARAYLTECLAVARAEGATLDDAVIDRTVRQFTEAPDDLTTSILTDRTRDRPLEWDVRNGVVARKGLAHGIATPVSDVLVPLLAAASDGPG